MNHIGAHVSGGNDLTGGLAEAKELGLEAMQVFLTPPQGFNRPKRDEGLEADFKAKLREAQIRLFVHAPYVLNFGSPKESSRASAASLLTSLMEKAGSLGAEGVVLHSGSSSTAPKAEGLAHLTTSLLPVLEGLDPEGPRVLLEPMAGQGNMLAGLIESLPAYYEAVKWHERLGLCLDTAHLLGSGEALDEDGGMDRVLADLDRLVGFDRLDLIHANDSKVPRGSKKDRHENLGLGHLHESVWPSIFAHPEVQVPLILETPGQGYASDLSTLRSARAQA